MLKQGLGLQARLERELLPNLLPNLRERIWSCSPRMLLSHLAWQARSPRYFRAVFGSMPPLPTLSLTSTSVRLLARVALPADRSPYKSPPTCITSAPLPKGRLNCPWPNYDCPRSPSYGNSLNHLQSNTNAAAQHLCGELLFDEFTIRGDGNCSELRPTWASAL